MNVLGKKKIVVLGLMSKIPVAGAVWGTVHYLIGLQRLGYDVYYVEAHARTPTMLMEGKDDGAIRAAAFISGIMERFDLGDRWAYHALQADGRCYGLSLGRLQELYRSAALIINYHGGTRPLPEHSATGRLVYLETDPVACQVLLHNGDRKVADLLAAHSAFFTWGINYGNADCGVPLPEPFWFRPTLPPVVPDLWEPYRGGPADTLTTVGNWRQPGEVSLRGEVYGWSKHHEFLKFLDLPRRTPQPFELALGSLEDDDRRLLEDRGWKVRPASELSGDLDAYRGYLACSRGEFTVAKDQNVRLRSGWFSERSAQYLAAGRPVITQETGFSNALPTGNGLFAFSTTDEILEAVEAINGNYEHHCRAARELAHDYFAYDVVLKRLLAEVGV
jgi:hypothetical protein